MTRRYRFSASHRLHCAQLSDAGNRELYGKCNNPYGHGHDYVLEVSVRGALDSETGRVVDVRRLDGLVQTRVLDAFDHKNLNADVAEFALTVPTTENLAVVVERRLSENWPRAFPEGPALDGVLIRETKNNTVNLSL